MSPFAEALHGLMVQSKSFSMDEWGVFLTLNIMPSAPKASEQIEAWLTDKELPKPWHLFMVYDSFVDPMFDHPVAERPFVDAFFEMAHRRSTEVSPHGKLMLPSVWEYMMRPSFNDVSSVLAKLQTTEEKEQFLERLYP